MGRLLSAKLIVRKIEWCFCAVSLFGNSTHSSIVNSKITFNNNIYTADWANECCDNNNCDYYCLVSPLCLLKQSNFQASFFMQTFFFCGVSVLSGIQIAQLHAWVIRMGREISHILCIANQSEWNALLFSNVDRGTEEEILGEWRKKGRKRDRQNERRAREDGEGSGDYERTREARGLKGREAALLMGTIFLSQQVMKSTTVDIALVLNK